MPLLKGKTCSRRSNLSKMHFPVSKMSYTSLGIIHFLSKECLFKRPRLSPSPFQNPQGRLYVGCIFIEKIDRIYDLELVSSVCVKIGNYGNINLSFIIRQLEIQNGDGKLYEVQKQENVPRSSFAVEPEISASNNFQTAGRRKLVERGLSSTERGKHYRN